MRYLNFLSLADGNILLCVISKVSKFTHLLNRGKLGLLLVMSLAVSLLHAGYWGGLRSVVIPGCQPGSWGIKEAAAGWTG